MKSNSFEGLIIWLSSWEGVLLHLWDVDWFPLLLAPVMFLIVVGLVETQYIAEMMQGGEIFNVVIWLSLLPILLGFLHWLVVWH